MARLVMKKMQSLEKLFKNRHFKRDIIVVSVRRYLRYKLSYRDWVEMTAERVGGDYTAIYAGV